MAEVSNLFCPVGQFQIEKKLWSCPQQDTVWCHLANLQESVAQFKEPVADVVPAKFEYNSFGFTELRSSILTLNS